MKKLILCASLVGCAALSACSSAGPFVTNVSSDGRGNLVIEKNTVHMNSFTGNVSVGDHPTTTTIRVIAE